MTDGNTGPTRLGAKLRAARQSLGWSQVELEQRSGVPQTLISRMELGRINDPGLKNLRSVAKALGVTVEDLADGGDAVVPSAAPLSLEVALFRVMDVDRYSVAAFDAARETLRAAGEQLAAGAGGRDEDALARALLDAASALVADKKPAAPLAVLARVLVAPTAPRKR